MEPRNSASGAFAADLTNTTQLPTQGLLTKNVNALGNHDKTRDPASLSPPGAQGQKQTGSDKSDGR